MEEKIYIAGAHSRARTFQEYISVLYPRTTVAAYLVDDLNKNKREINGIPVQKICREGKLHTDYPVYVATRGVTYRQIAAELKALGMEQVFFVDVALDSALRGQYVRKIFAKQQKTFLCVNDSVPGKPGETFAHSGGIRGKEMQAAIYVSSSVYDPALEETYELTRDEKMIQAGAALTSERLGNAVDFDDTGDNISAQNKQFCELTVLYWIWKNAKEDIVGLAHYRRHFLLPDGWLEWMCGNRVDVILPVPLYVAPSLEENYKGRHDPEDWEIMMAYLKMHHPKDYKAAGEFFKGGLYSPCNMFIMRKDVLADFCRWLFPILDAVVEHSGEREDPYRNRYPGFLSERLMTYYFASGMRPYKTAYANKNFLK